MITGLTGSFPAGSCTVSGDAGTPRQLAVNYTDADGDVSGGQLSVQQARFDSGGGGGPSSRRCRRGQPPVGTIIFNTCVAFKDNTAITETVVLVDAASRLPPNRGDAYHLGGLPAFPGARQPGPTTRPPPLSGEEPNLFRRKERIGFAGSCRWGRSPLRASPTSTVADGKRPIRTVGAP